MKQTLPTPTLPASVLTKKQKHVVGVPFIDESNMEKVLILVFRYDDECGNRHNSFSLTSVTVGQDIWKSRGADYKWSTYANHERIHDVAPQYEKYIKWHLTSSDGPMHYVANSTFHAWDRDPDGLRKGEKRQIINGRTGAPSWKLAPVDVAGNEWTHELPPYVDSHKQPVDSVLYKYVPWYRTGKGKEPNLEAARSCAVWPEAELEDFTEVKLLARLPALMEEFKRDMEELGFVY